tara:strand:+ start:1270 stop:2382 length:1113 start_codon:yes stop_codon:yes gene_type:complete
MSLKNALETAKEILENSDLQEADMLKMKKSKLASGGDDTDVEMSADGEGSKSADGVTPKIAKPVKPGGKTEVEGEMYKDEEEYYDEGEVATPGQTMKFKKAKSEEESYGVETPGQKKKPAMESIEAFQELFSSEDFSDDFKMSAQAVFETAIENQVDAIRDELYSEFQEKLEAEKEHLALKLDEYLSYVTEEWMKENEVAIDTGIRGSVTESFMVGLKELFETHYVTMPEESLDLVENLNDKIENLEDKLNESIEKNVELSKGLVKAQCESIYQDASKDLTVSEEARFRQLSEKVDFDSASEFQDKITTLKENFFNQYEETQTEVPTPLVEEYATPEEDALNESVELSPSMSAYTNMLNRINSVDKNKVS